MEFKILKQNFTMNIAIYGAGSLGTIIGAYLTKADLNVDLVNRNTSHIEGLRKKGAKIIGTVEMNVPVNAIYPEEMTRKYDLIFLLTKQLENKATVKFLSAFLTKDGVICTAQNGMPEALVSEIIGEDKTFGCAVSWGATMIGNGVCELTSSPDSLTFSIGTPGRDIKKLHEIKNVLEKMGTVTIESNFIGARWSKLLINSSFSGVSAVLGCTFGEAANNKKSRLCIQRIIKECIDVADKANINIEPIQGKNIRKLMNYNNKLKEYITFLLIPLVIKKHASLKPSMLQDLEKGKPCEIQSINGIVSEYGKKFDVPTPYNDKVIEIIHDIENGEYKPEPDNVYLFEECK
ncbi:ketopantoate reductase family protein [Saccharicrinis sp. FJH62]|uniref:ketopantoate reductase family protein n=1 Tax=Saccharicrinis sp. FJH62 TaxID=3344657 RepID=UPI0035D48EE7